MKSLCIFPRFPMYLFGRKFAEVMFFRCILFGLLVLPVFGNEPGAAALEFLEKIKNGKVDLKPGGDTAMQHHTMEDKRKAIHEGLKKAEKDLFGGSLELGDVKTDENFAAVIVRKASGLDSSQLQIFPVALVKSGADWVPAPVLASFENAVTGYTVSVRERLSMLESWMMRERVLGLEKLIEESEDRTRKIIRESSAGNGLEGEDLVKISEAFLDACSSGKQAAILGFLGGMSDSLPDDWPQRLKASEAAMAKKSATMGPWRLLVSPQVVRVRVNEEQADDMGLVSIACLDPARAASAGTLGKIEILHFNFSKDAEGRWRINLPPALLNNDSDGQRDDADLDVELLDRFPKRLRKLDGVVASPSPQAAETAVLAKLKGASPRELLRYVALEGSSKELRIAATAAAEMWWSMNDSEGFRVPIRLGFREKGMLAVAAFQWFSPSNPDRFEMKSLYFKKTEAGWLWAPGVVSSKERADQTALSKWVKENEAGWRLSWREQLLAPSPKLDAIDLKTQPNDSQVKELIEGWLSALTQRDIGKALTWIAWLGADGEIPMKSLRNLSYGITSADRDEGRLTGIYRSDLWVVAGISHIRKNYIEHSFVPVIMTAKGARILPEIDLLGETNQTRVFLNDASFERLARFAGDREVEDLENLFAKFQKDIGKN